MTLNVEGAHIEVIGLSVNHVGLGRWDYSLDGRMIMNVKCYWGLHVGRGGFLSEGIYQCDHRGKDGFCTLSQIAIIESKDGYPSCNSDSLEKATPYHSSKESAKK